MVAIALFCHIVICYGQIYKSVGANGETVFSDQPTPGAESIDLPPVQTYESATAKNQTVPSDEKNNAAESQTAAYKTLEISSPKNDESVRQNEGIVIVQANVLPNLREGDQFQLVMDGNVVGQMQTSPTFVLTNVDRGTHLIAVQIIDSKGNPVIQSSAITFHLLRYIPAMENSLPINKPVQPLPLPLSNSQIENLQKLEQPLNSMQINSSDSNSYTPVHPPKPTYPVTPVNPPKSS